MTGFVVRDGSPADIDAILDLMPRLADFDVPAARDPAHLWRDDAELARRWAAGDEACHVHVAVDDSGQVVGFSLARLRPELLSGAPSAHLEAIALARRAEGSGVAKALLAATEASVRAAGATSLTLHVFGVNRRARRFYEREGYDGELIRYIRRFDGPAAGRP